ncbi:hypothetical protein MRU69_13750 [Kocuria flava]|uniref:hypothetical protein n=1 Tax=Kocuria flava TaxID=446860 RepID=UPI001FF10CB0|nr:hypothetical protein [Kocuria flava]MCJ8505905.1 hypothetical protein [Kocuria flava]
MRRLDALSRETRASVLAGGLVALLIFIAGAVLALGQKTVYTAEAVTVILPRADLDDAASYYDTLSRGQIVGTFAEVAGNQRFELQAEDRLDLTEEERASAKTTVSVVPATSVILVQGVAEDSGVAERLANETTAVVTDYLSALSEPYRTEVVQAANGSAYVSSTSPTLLLGLSVVVAPIAGLAIQQAVYHLLTALRPRGRRRGPAWGTPEDVPSPRTTRTRSTSDHENASR